jgi:hypothetical protein
MDPFRLSLALAPLACYLLALGIINYSRRATVVAGPRDTLALGLALAGLVIVGPMELFMPLSATAFFGPLVWWLLLAFYGLCLLFLMLMERPRLVIYNLDGAAVRPLLATIAAQIDPDARWAGDSVALPNLGVQLRIEETRPMKSAVLLANGDEQSAPGWRTLHDALRRKLASVDVERNLKGLSLISFSVLAMLYVLYSAARDPAAVAQNLAQLLRL